jgi:hypothetical protein
MSKSIFDVAFEVIAEVISSGGKSYIQSGAIEYGNQKNDGSHDHRTNKGKDRTPAQQRGDKKRTKPKI